MSPRPDRRLYAAAKLVENLSILLPVARAHIRQQINAIDGLHGTSYDQTRTSERTMRVRIPCPQTIPCHNTHCPITQPHAHTCPNYGTTHDHWDNIPCTAVEAQAHQRITLEAHLADLEAHAKAIATITANALQDCHRIIGTRQAEVPRCNAKGRDGALEWADPTCTNIPTRGPLCDKDAKAEYRWRKARQLPPRRDGIFAGDLDAAS